MTRSITTIIFILCFNLHGQTLSSNQVETISKAIYLAEGGSKATWLYGIKSVSYKDAADANRICENSIRHDYQLWIDSGRHEGYFCFMSKIYCPLDSENWARNTESIYWKLSK